MWCCIHGSLKSMQLHGPCLPNPPCPACVPRSSSRVLLWRSVHRDLAEQTFRCVADYARHLSSPAVQCVLLVGGLDAAAQLRQVNGGVDVVVATPGRVLDFVESGKLGVDQARAGRPGGSGGSGPGAQVTGLGAVRGGMGWGGAGWDGAGCVHRHAGLPAIEPACLRMDPR